jgi:hypothetical protein
MGQPNRSWDNSIYPETNQHMTGHTGISWDHLTYAGTK